MVYFILNRASGAVKIGFSGQPEVRMSAIDTGSADDLELLGVIDGNRPVERALHREFKTFHRKKEWYNYVPELANQIADLLAGRGVFQPITPMERQTYDILIGELSKWGVLAFSRQHPNGKTAVACLKNLAFWLSRSSGKAGMRRVFDAVERYVCQHYPKDAVRIMHALDHRFDGIGGWYA